MMGDLGGTCAETCRLRNNGFPGIPLYNLESVRYPVFGRPCLSSLNFTVNENRKDNIFALLTHLQFLYFANQFMNTWKKRGIC